MPAAVPPIALLSLPPVVPVARRLCQLGAVVGLAYGPMLLWHGFSLSGLGGWSVRGVELFLLVPLVGMGLLVVALPLAGFAATRERSVACSLVGATLVLAFVPFLWLGAKARMVAFRWAGERAAPLVAAIERHVVEAGRPPARLQDLVPRWLDRLPTRVPELTIEHEAFGNPWILQASVPSGVLNWDQFFYFPNQDYPARGHGGSWQRLGRWAYLHE